MSGVTIMAKAITDHDVEEFNKFAQEFASESDRAAVILGAAKLDLLLYQAIQRYLLPNSSTSDELLDGDAPLGTFSSRIKLAHRLGLIDNSLTKALNLVRRIRNSFAHELSGISLNEGAHKDRIKELVAPFKVCPDWDTSFLHDHFKGCPGYSGEFRAVVAVMSARLDGVFSNIIPVNDSKAYSLVPGPWLSSNTKPTHSSTNVQKKKTQPK
jgi:DNA-binding MltR family transcriptional regulator